MENKPIVLLQVRASSSRLPSKALLHAGGYPLFILAALRAINTGLDLNIVTSNNTEDDVIENLSLAHGIRCIRGSLNDVLSRFAKALEGKDPETIVIRITADNVVPDGNFLEEMIKEFESSNKEYLMSDMVNMPYGLSAEVFRKKLIDHSVSLNLAMEEKEHVTTWIRKKFSNNVFSREEAVEFKDLRITVDTIEDYRILTKVLSHIDEPVKASVTQYLQCYQNEFLKNKGIEKFVLGGAQIGSSYGITNDVKNNTSEYWFDMLDLAYARGVRSIDTARAYDKSEAIIGDFSLLDLERSLNVFTKFPPEIRGDKQIEDEIQISLANLKSAKAKVFMFHRFSDYPASWRKSGIPAQLSDFKFGVSVQSILELREALSIPEVSHIQLPFNIVDYRWQSSAVQEMLSLKGNKTIHIRSIFLQGLLLNSTISKWPKSMPTDLALNTARKLLSLKDEFGFKSTKDLLFSYALSFNWVDGIVVGVTNRDELLSNLDSLSVPRLDSKQLDEIHKQVFNLFPEKFLNPANWNL